MSLLFDKSQCNGQYHKHPLMAMCKAPKSSNFPKEEAFFQVHLWLPLTQAFPMSDALQSLKSIYGNMFNFKFCTVFLVYNCVNIFLRMILLCNLMKSQPFSVFLLYFISFLASIFIFFSNMMA